MFSLKITFMHKERKKIAKFYFENLKTSNYFSKKYKNRIHAYHLFVIVLNPKKHPRTKILKILNKKKLVLQFTIIVYIILVFIKKCLIGKQKIFLFQIMFAIILLVYLFIQVLKKMKCYIL